MKVPVIVTLVALCFITTDNVCCQINNDNPTQSEEDEQELQLRDNAEVQQVENEPEVDNEETSDETKTLVHQQNTNESPETLVDDNSAAPVVHTLNGDVAGTTTRSHSGQLVSVYYGIPYGQPPTGSHRFSPPRPAEPWEGTFQATAPSLPPYQQVPQDLAVIQERLNQSMPKPWTEDCLQLHVWVPQPAPLQAQVLVFIHGGAFITESALLSIDGSSFAADEDVIVISVEYRLGVFGFLFMDHPEAPGNMGLMDQRLGLRWVKDNIASFGGDPAKVTLMGCSAGSASVAYHLTSPLSRGLFNRAILMSGVPSNRWAFTPPEVSLKKAEALVEALQCKGDTVAASVDCLRSKTPEELLASSVVPHYLASVQFGPTEDVISDSPERFNDVDALIGSTSDEGAEFFLLRNLEYAETVDSGVERKDFLDVLKGIHNSLSELEVQVLEVFYTNWSDPNGRLTLRDAVRHAYADCLFVCEINKFADNLAASPDRRVYRYVYDHKITPYWFPEIEWTGSVHAADQLSSLGPPTDQPESPQDAEIRVKVVKHFANFAKTGDPNIDGEPHWPQYHRSKGRSFNLLSGKSKIQQEYRTQECSAWLKLLPLIKGF